jgi:hypothetical protein
VGVAVTRSLIGKRSGTRKSLGGGEKPSCSTINGGKHTECFMCRRPKAKNAPKLWDKYVAACKKAGLDPLNPKAPKGDTDGADKPKRRRRSTRVTRK